MMAWRVVIDAKQQRVTAKYGYELPKRAAGELEGNYVSEADDVKDILEVHSRLDVVWKDCDPGYGTVVITNEHDIYYIPTTAVTPESPAYYIGVV